MYANQVACCAGFLLLIIELGYCISERIVGLEFCTADINLTDSCRRTSSLITLGHIEKNFSGDT